MFEKEVEWIESLNNDEELFEREVLRLKDLYDIPDFDEVHEFLGKNKGVIVLLNEVRPLFCEHAPYASLSLKVVFDPIFVPQLLLMAKAPEKLYFNGFKDEICIIDSLIDPLQGYLGLYKEFFIYDTTLED